ncbi:MAG: acyltransferase domain-containing protein, partial [Bacteroidetes bacterium]|nr:acyltransferase domain-containing protein [Bacteroidota bacterium]
KPLRHRRMLVCEDIQDAVEMLQETDEKKFQSSHIINENPEIIFMFPGQGSQYVNMGLSLYQTETFFSSIVDNCAQLLKPLLGIDIRHIIYPKDSEMEEATTQLYKTCYNQPALFMIEYSLAKLWESWGVVPSAMIGHSVGEYTAACLAGVFSLKDALMLVAQRGRLMQGQPEGAMLSIKLPEEEINKRIYSSLSIAAINSPSFCVVSGTETEIARFQQELKQDNIFSRLLETSHAFHSHMMDPVIEPFSEYFNGIKLSKPTIPFISTVTGTWITTKQATDPSYWAKHLRKTVLFSKGIKKIWEKPERILLELGPRAVATTLARQNDSNLSMQIAIPTLSDTANNHTEYEATLNALGRLWLLGVSINWKDYYKNNSSNKIAIPPYPFERNRFWLETILSPKNYSESNKRNQSQRIDQPSEFHKIEKVINSHSAITESLIVRKERPDRNYLIAYYVTMLGQNITVTDLRSYLHAKFSNDNMPDYFLELDTLPEIDSETITKNTLPDPFYVSVESENQNYSSPTTAEDIL